MAGSITDPVLTHTLDEFVAMKAGDDITYRNFSILDKLYEDLISLDHNLIDDYLTELGKLSEDIEMSDSELAKYKYSPDLLAYDLYGSTQFDFVILALNDMVDPKEFSRKTVKLVRASILKEALNQIYNANQSYLEFNRSEIDDETSLL